MLHWMHAAKIKKGDPLSRPPLSEGYGLYRFEDQILFATAIRQESGKRSCLLWFLQHAVNTQLQSCYMAHHGASVLLTIGTDNQIFQPLQ